MPLQQFLHVQLLPVLRVRLQRRHIRRWRRYRSSEQSFQRPGAPQHRTGFLVTRRHRQHTAQADHARSPVVRPLHQVKLLVVETLYLVFQLIELHQPLGQVRVVGVQQLQQAAVLAQDSIEQQDRLLP